MNLASRGPDAVVIAMIMVFLAGFGNYRISLVKLSPEMYVVFDILLQQIDRNLVWQLRTTLWGLPSAVGGYRFVFNVFCTLNS